MRVAGMVIFLVGFLGGAFVIVREANAVTWSHYGVVLFIAFVGVVLLRLSARAKATDQSATMAGMQVVLESLSNVVERIRLLNAEREKTGVYGIHGRIDNELMEEINRFVEVRETIITVHGLDVYAKTMDAFASGERALNRAWSASADGYIDEVWACLERAERQVERALGFLKEQKA